MDYTQQTIAQITAEFTELAHDLHDKGAINEWKLKELLDLGMALAKPNHTAAGRKSGPELVDENEKLSAMHSQVMVWCKGLLNGHVTLRKHRDELMAVNTLIRKDKEWKCRTIKTASERVESKIKMCSQSLKPYLSPPVSTPHPSGRPPQTCRRSSRPPTSSPPST